MSSSLAKEEESFIIIREIVSRLTTQRNFTREELGNASTHVLVKRLSTVFPDCTNAESLSLERANYSISRGWFPVRYGAEVEAQVPREAPTKRTRRRKEQRPIKQ